MARIQTQRHPYNSLAFRLCKRTDLAPFTPALLIATGNQQTLLASQVCTLCTGNRHWSRSVALLVNGLTGSLNRVLSRSQVKKHHFFRCPVKCFLRFSNNTYGLLTKVSVPTDACSYQACRFAAWKLQLIL